MTLSSSALMILTIPLLLVNSFLTLPSQQRRVYDSITRGTSSNPRLSTERSMNIGYLSDYYDYYENKEDKHRKDGPNDDEDVSFVLWACAFSLYVVDLILKGVSV